MSETVGLDIYRFFLCNARGENPFDGSRPERLALPEMALELRERFYHLSDAADDKKD